MTDFPKHKHRPCPCGCGELADECMRPGSALNAFQISGDYRTEADYNLAASRAVAAEQRAAEEVAADLCPRCGGDHDRIDRREPCPNGTTEQTRPCGCYVDDPGCPPEHAEFNAKGQ